MANPCIYCGKKCKATGKGEHIVPDALGGWKSIRTVCEDCNNRLGDIDNEFVSRSPMSTVRWHYFGRSNERATIIDCMSGVSILGAVDWAQGELKVLPQFIPLSDDRFTVLGDVDEMSRLEPGRYIRSFLRLAKDAFGRFRSKARKGGIHFAREEGASFAPTRHAFLSISTELAKAKRTSKMELRFSTAEQRRVVLQQLERLNPEVEASAIGFHDRFTPARMSREWNLLKTIRALIKIAINILADELGSTFEPAHFRRAMDMVTGKSSVPENVVYESGFCSPDSLSAIKGTSDEHTFRLLHDPALARWHFYASWFGGQLNSLVTFPADGHCGFRTLDVRSEINNPPRPCMNGWKSTRSNLLLVEFAKIRRSWNDRNLIIPNLPIESLQTYTRIKAIDTPTLDQKPGDS